MHKLRESITHRGDGDEHEVEAVAKVKPPLVRVLVVVPGIAGVLKEVAEAGRADNLEKV